RRRAGWRERGATLLFACLATLLGAPVSAATTDVNSYAIPLQTGTPYPAPNIMFILDDSGSMTYSAMPADVTSFSRLDNDIFDKSYVHNTLYYNPYTDYEPWKKADNSRYTGGKSYNAVYSSDDLASGYTTNLCDETQVYFVPKAGAKDLDDEDNYDEYRISCSGSDFVVIKTGPEKRESWNNRDIDKREWWYGTIDVPAGATRLVVTAENGRGGDADLDRKSTRLNSSHVKMSDAVFCLKKK